MISFDRLRLTGAVIAIAASFLFIADAKLAIGSAF